MKYLNKKSFIILMITSLIAVLFTVPVLGEKVVTDMTGREVRLPDQVNRIVTSYRSASQFVFALDVQDRLVASDLSFEKVTLFKKIYEGEKIPSVGSKRHGLNFEQIIEVDPDLVILYPHNDGPKVAKRLEQFGIASIIIVPESYDQIKKATKILGEALGVKARAQQVIKQYDKILNLVRDLDNIENKKKVYFANSDLFDTVGDKMLQTSMIELAGGINPAKEVKSGFIKTSLEELMNWNPDQIVVSQFYSKTLKDILESKELSSLKAVQKGNVLRFPSVVEPWDFPSPSSYLGIIWLAKKLYPTQFSDLNINEVVNDYYLTLYGKSFIELGGNKL